MSSTEGSCYNYGDDRRDCNRNPLYCTDPVACNYDEMGSCDYHGSREDCDGSKLYCDSSQAINYNDFGNCRMPTLFTNDTLSGAVDEWIDNSNAAEYKYGPISNWDVSRVTDMSNLFKDRNGFNEDIGNWNVSNVTDMESMFKNAEVFNQDIGNWDVSKVSDMEYMFYNAEKFNQDIEIGMYQMLQI